MTSSPARATTSTPLIVTGTPATSGASVVSLAVSVMPGPLNGGGLADRDRRLRGAGGALLHAAPDVRLELGAEALQGRRDRRHRGRTERADGGLLGRPGDAGADVVAHV